MSEPSDRERVMAKIGRVFAGLEQVLVAGNRPTIFLPEDEDDNAAILELKDLNAHRFIFVTRLLSCIQKSLVMDWYRTKRDLYEENKDLFVNQATLDQTLNFVSNLLRESRQHLRIIRDDQFSQGSSSSQGFHSQSFNGSQNENVWSQESWIIADLDHGYYSQERNPVVDLTSDDQPIPVAVEYVPELAVLVPMPMDMRPEDYAPIETSLMDTPPTPIPSTPIASTRNLPPPASPILAVSTPIVPTPTAPVTPAAKRPQRKKRNNRFCQPVDGTAQVRPNLSRNFRVQLTALTERGYLDPTTGRLKYKDPEDVVHEATLIRRGGLKSNDDGRSHKTIESWLRSIHQMRPRQRAGLDNESKRINSNHRSMLSYMRDLYNINEVAPIRLLLRRSEIRGRWFVDKENRSEDGASERRPQKRSGKKKGNHQRPHNEFE